MKSFLPLLGFVVVGTVTPGPNNLMVLISGANYGLGRTIPHIAGIAFGFPVMIVAVGLGLGAVFEAVPQLHVVLKYVAFAYLVWLAWRIALAQDRPDAKEGRARPLTFFEAAAFQWVNPKAWALVFSAVALFTSQNGSKLLEIGLIAALFGLICLPNGVVWTLFGSAISRLLADDVWRRRFNIAMAALLIASVIPTLL